MHDSAITSFSFAECLDYIRIGYKRVATYHATYDVGQLFLVLLERRQPSMRSIIREMFNVDLDDDSSRSVDLKELEESIAQFQGKLFKKDSRASASVNKKSDEHWTIETSVRLDKSGF